MISDKFFDFLKEILTKYANGYKLKLYIQNDHILTAWVIRGDILT